MLHNNTSALGWTKPVILSIQFINFKVYFVLINIDLPLFIDNGLQVRCILSHDLNIRDIIDIKLQYLCVCDSHLLSPFFV